MKKRVIVVFASLVLALSVVLFIFYKKTPIAISHVSTIYGSKAFPKGGLPHNADWFAITCKEQHDNWVKRGLALPECDFQKNFLIVSNRKMMKLSYTLRDIDECSGVPTGIAEFDEQGAKDGGIYVYKMEKIWLSQTIG